VVPLTDIFQFEWDGWADALMKKFMLKKRRASLSVGQGLAKLFRAWTHTKEARTWQRLPRAKIIDFVRQGFETVELNAEQDQDEYRECHLSIPNLHWDASDSDARLQ